ncbi:MAG: radical SAM protein [Nitrospiraceae bacterium]|nr:radical SAM protein [Nitrospiraceae bacterium]
MSRASVLLLNPNRMLPPIAPVGLEYVANGLAERGYEPVICDLTFSGDWRGDLTRALDDTVPAAVGVTVRNIDDAYFASQDFTLETTGEIVRHVTAATQAPVVLGGVGFSCAPAQVLSFTGAGYGIVGDGEAAFPALLDCLEADGDPTQVAGAAFRLPDGRLHVTPPVSYDPAEQGAPSRTYFDNPRYFAEGGQLGIETKRGCGGSCIYCMEPAAKGNRVRLRSPEAVADEFAALLDQGIYAVHLCDSEFNRPAPHARAVCEALVSRGLGERLRWYVYAAPTPFDGELAAAMAAAGCAGIDFGVDHADEGMLRRLGRDFGPEDIARTAEACRDRGIEVMFDMMFGAPGETRESIAWAIDFLRDVAPGRVGLSCGVRVYPNTPLAAMVREGGPLEGNPCLHGAVQGNEDFLRPIFYVDVAIGEDINAYVASLIRGDERFLHADPSETDGNYNYNDNSVLAQAIRAGERGAYWDILRRLAARSS